MFRKRIGLLISAMLLLGLVSGCAGVAPGDLEGLTSGLLPESFVLKLPTIYVEYLETPDGSAEPSLSGIGASLIESWFGVDLSTVKIPAFYVDWIKDSNLQHIEILTDDGGFFFYANGMPLPYMAWDAESLAAAADLAGAFGVANIATIKTGLPWLQRVGLDIVVQMPLSDDPKIIAYRDARAGLLATTAAPEIKDPVGEIKLHMAYDEEGYPSVLGLPAQALQAMLGFTPGQMDPQIIAQLKQTGVESLTLRTRGDGLFIFMNDQPLPNVAWSPEHIVNALDLYAQMNEVSWVPNEGFVTMVRELVLQTTNFAIELVVDFL
ncbi:MAG TPA: hypothetical protein VM537_35140 [Anaerolineae bacterium]|nr:hypothetical protein [Anaerolineae bacterium]